MEKQIKKLHAELEVIESKISCLREDSRTMTTRVIKYSDERKAIQSLITQLKTIAKNINEKIYELTQ